MSGSFGSHEQGIDALGRFDLAEVQVEAVGAHQHVAWSQVGLDVGAEQIPLDFIGEQDVDDVRTAACLVDLHRLEAMADSKVIVLATGALSDNHLATAIAQVLCLRVPLGAVSQDCDGLVFENRKISVLFVIDFCSHAKSTRG